MAEIEKVMRAIATTLTKLRKIPLGFDGGQIERACVFTGD